jgi:release factor glutamine methyltransferase
VNPSPEPRPGPGEGAPANIAAPASPMAADRTDVDAALARARVQGVDRLDAQLLVAHHLQRPRSWVIAHGDAEIPPQAAAALRSDLERRAAGWPLAYLVGRREFHGLDLAVDPSVLIPRPDTEVLVDWGLALLAEPAALASRPAPRVADLGTGSGAIALAIKAGCPRASVRAVERSADALAVARANGERLALGVEWRLGDWWQPLTGERLDLVLSNPPYIPAGDPHLPALAHEPIAALVPPDGEGLSALAKIVDAAGRHLTAGGWLLLEHGHDQADAVAARLQRAGFDQVQHRQDLAGHRRCTGGRWAG